MCRMFANVPQALFESETRSVRLAGHATSIRLERAFWTILEEIAEQQSVSLPKFLTKLHDEVIETTEARHNFTSLLRCACLTYLTDVRGSQDAQSTLSREAAHAFALAETSGRARPS